ncbi:MAG: PHP domain-containing protein [Magnetococcales bacterium]|nr:PHP domain-containing protein [Magnetococcales bacterium]
MRRKPDIKTLFIPATPLPAPIPPWEYHAHSNLSDGLADLSDMVDQAINSGLTRLIFTEHTEPDIATESGWFRRYLDQLRALREKHRDRIMIGIGLEVPITDFDGGLLLTSEMAEHVEFILGAVHSYPGHGWDVGTLEPERAVELEYKGLMALAENPQVDAIAHPGGICHLYNTPFPMERFEEVVKKATANGIAIELNPAYQNPMEPYLKILQRHNALISPGSNAHAPFELGRAWKTLQKLADKGERKGEREAELSSE